MLDCENYITYKKLDPSEIIEVGDVIMIDPSSGYITRAIKGDKKDLAINSRMVIGVCIWSNNSALVPIILDGGSAKDVTKTLIETTSDSTEIICLSGGTSEQNQREIIQVAYTGEYPVNVCGFVDIGDKLAISNHAGKAKAIEYIDGDYFITRSIGKCVKFMKNKEQVKVLLDIE
jgi:hypothetical protein